MLSVEFLEISNYKLRFKLYDIIYKNLTLNNDDYYLNTYNKLLNKIHIYNNEISEEDYQKYNSKIRKYEDKYYEFVENVLKNQFDKYIKLYCSSNNLNYELVLICIKNEEYDYFNNKDINKIINDFQLIEDIIKSIFLYDTDKIMETLNLMIEYKFDKNRINSIKNDIGNKYKNLIKDIENCDD